MAGAPQVQPPQHHPILPMDGDTGLPYSDNGNRLAPPWWSLPSNVPASTTNGPRPQPAFIQPTFYTDHVIGNNSASWGPGPRNSNFDVQQLQTGAATFPACTTNEAIQTTDMLSSGSHIDDNNIDDNDNNNNNNGNNNNYHYYYCYNNNNNNNNINNNYYYNNETSHPEPKLPESCMAVSSMPSVISPAETLLNTCEEASPHYSLFPPFSDPNPLITSTPPSTLMTPPGIRQNISEFPQQPQGHGRGVSYSPRSAANPVMSNLDSGEHVKRLSTGSYDTTPSRRTSALAHVQVQQPFELFEPFEPPVYSYPLSTGPALSTVTATATATATTTATATATGDPWFGDGPQQDQYTQYQFPYTGLTTNGMTPPGQPSLFPPNGFQPAPPQQYGYPPQPAPYGTLRTLRTLRTPHDDTFGLLGHGRGHSAPPDLYASLRQEETAPPPEDMETDDPALIPREQGMRFNGDFYGPRWIRGHGHKREGWCGICKPGRWLVLKNSAYWYDKSFTHGISAVTGNRFQQPLHVRRIAGSPDSWEALCGSCHDWVVFVSGKKRGTTWFRHAYKCHRHTKVKAQFKRRRQRSQSRASAARGTAKQRRRNPTPQNTHSSGSSPTTDAPIQPFALEPPPDSQE
ncbi:hypothetical protein GGR50DRAFT_678583 [Xylaria sp. CBS 124048]|nr:hypothetical protein GGR50DRAFT_678583 [Xylaria sp. CBS 124048]